MRQAAIEAGKEEIAIARKGVVEADKPLLKQIEGLGVTVTQLSPAEREAFVKATRPVYDKWKSQVGTDLVNMAEKRLLRASNKYPAPQSINPLSRGFVSLLI